MKHRKLIALTIFAIVLISFSLTKGNITGGIVGFGQGCCDTTCTETTESRCDGIWYDGEDCFDIQECNIGCCIDGEGYCYSNYLNSLCIKEGKKFVGGRECPEYKQCMVPPKYPADQEGYVYTNAEGVMAVFAEPVSGSTGTIFEISAVLFEEQANVRVNISHEGFSRILQMRDDGVAPDKIAGDEQYTVKWNSAELPGITEISNVSLQVLLSNEAKGFPGVFYISPNQCVPANYFYLPGENKTKIILARKENMDYIDLRDKVGGFQRLVTNYTRFVEDYTFYILEDPINSLNSVNIQNICPFTLNENDIVVQFDIEEDLCTQNGQLVTLANIFEPKKGTLVRGKNFTKEFCEYVDTPYNQILTQDELASGPTVEILGPANNSRILTPTSNFIFVAEDNKEAKLRYKIYLDDDNNQLAWGYMQANDTVTRNIGIEDGLHEIYVIVEDLDGNLWGDARIIDVNASNFIANSTLQEEMVSLSDFSFDLSYTHESEDNLSYYVYDGKRIIQTGKILKNETKNINLNLTPGEHIIRAAIFDSVRKASTISSAVTVFGLPSGTVSASNIKINITSVDSQGTGPDPIYYEMYTAGGFQAVDICDIDEDTNIIDEICLSSITTSGSSVQLVLNYDHGGDSYLQKVDVKIVVDGVEYSKQAIITNTKPSGTQIDSKTINFGGLNLLTGNVVLEERFSPTVTNPYGEPVTVGNQTKDGGYIGPDGLTYFPVDKADSYEAQKLCGSGKDTGKRYRQAECVNKWLTEVQLKAGFKRYDNATQKYTYEYEYQILCCNENIFVDVYLRNCNKTGDGLELNTTNATTIEAGCLAEERYSTTLGVAYTLSDNQKYESALDFKEICIYTSDDNTYFGGNQTQIPICFSFGIPQCNDGIDNMDDPDGLAQGDGLCDYAGCTINNNFLLPDPGCSSPNDNDESDGTSQCQDNEDNDGDGFIDEADKGCHQNGNLSYPYMPLHNNEASATTQCQDGIDNDDDGVCDVLGCLLDNGTLLKPDPGCNSTYDDYEGDKTTQCQDDEDNDKEGDVDENDPNCYTSLSCFEQGRTCYDKTINAEAGAFFLCDAYDYTIVKLTRASRLPVGAQYRYDLDYGVYACSEGMKVTVKLKNAEKQEIVEDYNLPKDDEKTTSKQILKDDSYNELCFETLAADYGTQCFVIS